MVGGLGLGLALGLASIVARESIHDDDFQLAIDLGPQGGGISLGARF
jgi:acyl CoA:acetate/3-ketoacid CoA transferase